MSTLADDTRRDQVPSELLAKYDGRVPRYTSYPTAPHFSAEIDGATYARWLSELDPADRLSLYLHVPFCDTLCWFCGCNTTVVNKRAPVDQYFELLLREIDLVAQQVGADRPGGKRTVAHLHAGGGSPTILSPQQIRRLFAKLREFFVFAEDAEIAVEIDPRGLPEESIAAFAESGLTRASIGVQDLTPEVQRAVNRIQPHQMTARCVEQLRRHGVASLNLDLMYGLPHQTVAGTTATVERILELAPDRIALFGYAHVPWMKKHQKLIREDALPGAEERWAQFRAAADRLSEAGYVAVGLDHFARPHDAMAEALRAGTLRRNFQGYTVDRATALLGLGASAIGGLPQGHLQNAPNVRDYKAAIDAGRLPTAPVGLRNCLADSVERVREAYPDADISVEFPEEEPSVRANERLERVFANLVENAVVHSDRGPVAVSATATATAVRVTVRDSGPGLPERQRALLETGDIGDFDNPGTGFGLNVVRLLVEDYAGAIETAVDDGTAITVTLPRAAPESPQFRRGRAALVGVRPALAHLVVTLVAAALAGVAYGAVSIALGGSVSGIGVFYGTADPVVGWLTHEFHSVVFGFAFVSLLSLAPERYRENFGTYVAIGAGWGVALWVVAAGVVAPVWLRLLGNAVAVPNLSVRLLVNHVVWGVVLGTLTAWGFEHVVPWWDRLGAGLPDRLVPLR